MSVATEVKVCRACCTAKPLADFYTNRATPDGLTRTCKTCSKIAARKWLANWRATNPDLAREAARKHAKAWRTKYPEKSRKKAMAHYNANPQASLARWHTRRVRKQNAGGSFTVQDITNLLALQKGRCAHPWCRTSLQRGKHIDHILPLARGGTNSKRNLQLLCPPCNRQKHATHPVDFAIQNGSLV